MDHQLVLAERVGDDLALVVGEDVVGDIGEARMLADGAVPELAVADGVPSDGVALQLLTARPDVAFHTDGDDLQAVAAHLFLLFLQLAQRAHTFEVVGVPDGDDVDLGGEIGGFDRLAVDVGDGEGGQATAVFEVAETFEMLFEVFYFFGGIGARLDDERQQVGSTLVVGLRRLDEDLTDEIEGEG